VSATDRFSHEERDEEQAAGIDAERHDQFVAQVDECKPFPPDDYPDHAKAAMKRLPITGRRGR
jgi:hypothetical protein